MTTALRRLTGPMSFLLPLAAYVATLAPTVTLEDSGSFIVAARFLGVAHPPGFPLWCLLAHVFTVLPVASVAERVHLSSAVFAAAACWVVYLIALRRTATPWAALAAALALGFSQVLWSQAVIAEVYALNTLFAAVLLYLALRWREGGSERWLHLLALASGLALAGHTMSVLVLVAVWPWALADRRLWPLRPSRLATLAALGAVGLTVYLYLPLRARADPPVNWHDPETLSAVIAHIRRAAYLTQAEQARYLGTTQAVVQHTLDAWRQSAGAIGVPLAALALGGLALCWRRGRGFALVTLAVFLLHTLAFNAYVHAQFTPVWRFAHRVYYIPAHLSLALWLAPALAWLGAGGWWRNQVPARRRHRGWRAVVVALTVAWFVVMGLRHAGTAGLRGEDLGRRFGLDVMSVLPPQAGILPVGDLVVFTSLYLKTVEGVRADVQVLAPSFGWRGEPVSRFFGIQPLTPALVADFPWLDGLTAAPFGLGYLYVPPEQARSVPFVTIDETPEPARLLGDGRAPPGGMAGAVLHGPVLDALFLADASPPDPFQAAVRHVYAGYHARNGERLLAEGDVAAGLEQLDLAERLGHDDAHVLHQIALVYLANAQRRERVPALVRQARDALRDVDPAAYRYYPVGPADLDRIDRLDRLDRPGGPADGGSPPGASGLAPDLPQ
ncbi:MAG: DUF2723 domain-containing protein [Candidatus Krumholzibacteriia bacterium]